METEKAAIGGGFFVFCCKGQWRRTPYTRLPHIDKRYTIMAIQSFRDKATEELFEGKTVAKYANFRSIAERKLQLLESAVTLNFLRSPPGNHLEALRGNRKGQHSIRINDQFRLCFRWTDKGPADVEIVDYH